MATTALGQEEQDCALRALNFCDGAMTVYADRSPALCHCASRDLCGAVGWTGAERSHELNRLEALGTLVLGSRPPRQR